MPSGSWRLWGREFWTIYYANRNRTPKSPIQPPPTAITRDSHPPDMAQAIDVPSINSNDTPAVPEVRVGITTSPGSHISRDRSPNEPSSKKRRKLWLWQQDEILKAKMSTVMISGGFLIFTLAIYLGLTLTNHNRSQYFHFLMIMLVFVITLMFCHALIRLCVAATRLQKRRNTANNIDIESTFDSPHGRSGTEGFVEFSRPIRVEFLEDAERRGAKDAAAVPPPAYGLWRNSVRVNPNQFYWAPSTTNRPVTPTEEEEMEINGSANAGGAAERNRSENGNRRPPSYVSEDGVAYALSDSRPAGTMVLLQEQSAGNGPDDSNPQLQLRHNETLLSAQEGSQGEHVDTNSGLEQGGIRRLV